MEQGIAQIQLIMRHIRTSSEIGKLAKIALQWWQLLAGTSFPLLQNTTANLEYTGQNWFTSLRTFLHSCQGNLIIPNAINSTPKLIRANDVSIMDEILKHDFKKQEMENFNRVRLWMGVYSIAEISTAAGDRITTEAWEGTRIRYTQSLWPIQDKPGKQSFHSWRKMLYKVFLIPHNFYITKQ